MRIWNRTALVVAVLFVMSSMGWAQRNQGAGVTVQAELDPQSAYVNSMVIYVLTVQGVQSQSQPQPELGTLDPSLGTPKEISTQQAISSQVVITPNGRQMINTTSFIYRYAITPTKEGRFVIPQTRIQVDGRTIESNEVTLVVTKIPSASNVPTQLQGMVAPVLVPRDPALQARLNGAVFVLPVVTNPNPYNGEQVRVSFHLVIDAEALDRAGLQLSGATIANPQPPAMNEFLKEDLYILQESRPYREQMIGGKKYQVMPLYEAAITSTKTGKLTIEPFKLSLLVHQRGGRTRNMPDPFSEDFDVFFGGFGGRSRNELIVQSMPVDIDVKPLPTAGRPAQFSGAVGDFSLSATPDRDTAAANDDIVKVQLTIEGQGDVSSIPAPEFPRIPGVTVLGTPKSSTQARKENDDLISTRKIDYLVRASQPGRLEIPPIALVAFNPKTDEYQTLESNPAEVSVSPGTRPAPPLQANTGDDVSSDDADAPTGNAARPEGDLRYIHTGALAVSGSRLFGGSVAGFLVLAVIPPLILLAGFLMGRRQLVTAGELRDRRQKRALEVAQRHLRESEKLLTADDRSQFFNELGRSIRGYFGDKFGLEPGSLTIEQIQEELSARNASDETIALAERILEQCDAARYSPVQPETEVARAAYNDAADLLNRVEQTA